MLSLQGCLRILAIISAIATAAGQSLSSYGTAALRNVMVPARDGVKLATDVYLPSRDGTLATGRFPAIVERTPYNKEGVLPSLIE